MKTTITDLENTSFSKTMNSKNKPKKMSRMERKYFVIRHVSRVLILTMLMQILIPARSKALTTGPSQPEVMQFQQAGTSGMVDPFTGAFNYNIPLFELPGPNGSYPFNLAYQSGITMDQEASWVGLGWSLNPGAITRTMRGLPDEFDGDEVHIDQDMKADWTVGVKVGGNFELFGADLKKGIWPATLTNNNSTTGGLPFGLSVYYNSYQGLGYSVDAGLTMVSGKNGGNPMLAGGGFNLSLDSQDGIGLSPSFNFGYEGKEKNQIFALGAGYNSRRGLTDISLGYSGRTRSSSTSSGESPLGFRSVGAYLPAATAYPPIIDKKMLGASANFRIKVGLSLFGADPNGYVSGFYSRNGLASKDEDVKAFGFLNLHNAEEKDMVDLNREGDGLIRKESQNLAAPILTNDVYQFSGQGTGGAFRAWRNDVPIVGNRLTNSGSGSFSWGNELNPTKAAIDIALGTQISSSGLWENRNEILELPLANTYGFEGNHNYSKDFEPWYFKEIGDNSTDPESDLDYINGTGPIRVGMGLEDTDEGRRGKILNKLEDEYGNEIPGLLPKESFATDNLRRKRNTVISNVKIKELNSASTNLGEYDIKHYEVSHGASTFVAGGAAPTFALSRSHPDHHFAGMSVDKADGARYVYGLPAYNLKQIESVFSVDGAGYPCDQQIPINNVSNGNPNYKVSQTDQYFHKTTIPEYAHSYLLTSVLGQDYVDADGIAGPSDGDLGYWVKFNYVKIQEPFKWRAPFGGANLMKGNLSTIQDDKGSYTYGEREQWYLASVETKTHIAEFKLIRRLFDGRGAATELQTGASSSAWLGSYSYQLDQIELFSKLELAAPGTPSPISRINFDYEDIDQLCDNVQNGTGGKLTLKSVRFSHEESTRGRDDNPYEFIYATENPDYDPYAQDKWGNYREIVNCENRNYPYVNQAQPRAELDNQNAAWHLSSIKLPTGGIMNVDYEANDYAYVQNKPAMEMYSVSGLGSVGGSMVYNSSYDETSQQANQRTIFVDLGRNIYSQAELDFIMKDIDQVYIKSLIELKKSTDYLNEYVSAYLDVESYDLNCSQAQVPNGCSSIKIVLKPCTWNDGKLKKYHPLAVAAWTYLRTNLPQLITIPSFGNTQIDPGTYKAAIRQKARSLVSIVPEFVQIFKGFYLHARDSHWAKNFDPGQSWVRLNSQAKNKVGGGSRVKQITLSDEFGNFGNGVETGVVYDYSIEEGGKTISSGVAAYEPMIGGDENPLRSAKRFKQHTPLKTSLSLFSQLPINESYMPSPTIGYRKVTVKSLATQKVLDSQLAATVPTTGAAVHEFWTAKDFPVEYAETEIDAVPYNLPIGIPLVGMLHFNHIAATQGYSIVLNDMHGKPKRVSNYGQDKNGNLASQPIDWVEYEYSHSVIAQGTPKEKRRVQNFVNALDFDVDGSDPTKSLVNRKILAQEHEYFVDMREYKSTNVSGGLASNVDNFAILGWIPSMWPSFGFSKSHARTAVTNKIIHKSGILIGTRAYNQGSLVKTDNLLFDSQTGRSLLTRVTNDYDRPIYSYEYPAFWAYDQMGPAYKNIGLEISNLTVNPIGGFPPNYYEASGVGIGSAYEKLLIPGDELVVLPSGGSPAKAWFIGFSGSNAQFYCESNIASSSADFRIVRSGRRNLLNVTAEQIVSLKNPTVNRGELECWRDVNNPATELANNSSNTVVTTTNQIRPCFSNIITRLNLFFANPASSSPGQSQYFSGNWGCGACDLMGLSIAQNSTGINVECLPGCELEIRDSNGLPINLTTVVRIGNPNIITSGGPLPYSGPNGAFGVQIDVEVVGSSTPILGFFDNCPSLFDDAYEAIESEVTTYTSTYSGTPNPAILQTNMFMIDSVLSATAQTFSDAWMQDFSDVRFDTPQQLSDLEGRPPFANGQRGVWRPKDSYVYVADRRQSNDVNTGRDGTFSGVPMFDFQTIMFDHCAENWRKTNEVTRYSPYGFELENRDVLNTYSAALYGYNGKLPTAVCANADYRELGFESFEEYGTGMSLNLLQLSSSNLDFPTDFTASPRNVWTYTDIIRGDGSNFYLHGTLVNSILIHPIPVVQNVTEGMAQGRTHGITPTDPSVPFGEKQKLNSIIGSPPTAFNLYHTPYLHLQVLSPQYTGRVVYQRPTITFAGLGGQISYSDEKAHTGKRSLEITGKATFPQNRLKLKEGNSYTLQMWVSRDNTDQPSYRNASPQPSPSTMITFYDENDAPLSSTVKFEPSGEIVDGWQKIEGNFEVPAGTENIVFEMDGGQEGGVIVNTYFDDIRIQPLKSKMTCYVYNTDDYRLRATLDDDNFALLYHYDEAGNLYLVQKETIEGLRTIQESRSYMFEN